MMAKTAGLWVLFTLVAMGVALGITIAFNLGVGAAFMVGLVCGCPAGFGAIFVAGERGWI